MITVTCHPTFDAETFFTEGIKTSLLELEVEVTELGERILSYMQQFITARIHRDGSTGNLVRSINIEYFSQGVKETLAGVAFAGWGIGKISDMNKEAPYWYLINYGGMSFVAHFGLGVGGSFNGDAPDSMKAGSGIGKQRFNWKPYQSFVMFPKNLTSPMGYIEASHFELDRQINTIIAKLKG